MEKLNLPGISVVTPVYNGAGLIESTIQSVLSQNYPRLNYIIIDGGSKDGTVDIIKKYSDRLSHWLSEKDNGLYDALNKGFELSAGEIMCWLNADDLHHPNCLNQVAEIFNQFPEVEWITGVPTVFDKNGICRQIVPQRKWSKYQYLQGDYFTIQQESVFWRRSLWERAGARLTDKYRLAGDFELWLRFFRAGARLYSTQLPLGGFRRHSSGQLSSSIKEYANEVRSIYNSIVHTDEEKKVLDKINKLEKLNKIPYLRGKMKINEKINCIYDFPPEIAFDFMQNKFFLKR